MQISNYIIIRQVAADDAIIQCEGQHLTISNPGKEKQQQSIEIITLDDDDDDSYFDEPLDDNSFKYAAESSNQV
jgi:hypothetical protein